MNQFWAGNVAGFKAAWIPLLLFSLLYKNVKSINLRNKYYNIYKRKNIVNYTFELENEQSTMVYIMIDDNSDLHNNRINDVFTRAIESENNIMTMTTYQLCMPKKNQLNNVISRLNISIQTQ